MNGAPRHITRWWWVRAAYLIALIHVLAPLTEGWLVPWIVAPLALAMQRGTVPALCSLTLLCGCAAAWLVGAPLWEWLAPLSIGVLLCAWSVHHWRLSASWLRVAVLMGVSVIVWQCVACAHHRSLVPMVRSVWWWHALQHGGADGLLTLLLMPAFAAQRTLQVEPA